MDKNEITPISWFEKHGIKDYDLVMSNPWKGRQCYVFKDNTGKKFFLKWNDCREQFLRHKELLQKEERIYCALSNQDITPRYIGGEMFVTEYIAEGDTLRKTIKELLNRGEEEPVSSLISKMLNKWCLLREVLSSKMEFSKSVEKTEYFNVCLKSLLLSGPIGTRWDHFYTRYRNYAILKFFQLWYGKRIRQLLEKKKTSVIHGDFHANNVFVEGKGNVYILDYENVQIGIPEVELAYMMSQIDILVKPYPQLGALIDNMANDVIKDKILYATIRGIFDKGIRLNKRFF